MGYILLPERTQARVAINNLLVREKSDLYKTLVRQRRMKFLVFSSRYRFTTVFMKGLMDALPKDVIIDCWFKDGDHVNNTYVMPLYSPRYKSIHEGIRPPHITWEIVSETDEDGYLTKCEVKIIGDV